MAKLPKVLFRPCEYPASLLVGMKQERKKPLAKKWIGENLPVVNGHECGNKDQAYLDFGNYIAGGSLPTTANCLPTTAKSSSQKAVSNKLKLATGNYPKPDFSFDTNSFAKHSNKALSLSC